MNVMLGLLLDPEIDAYVRQMAQETERSRGATIRYIIRQYALAHGRPDLAVPPTMDRGRPTADERQDEGVFSPHSK